VIDRAAHLDAVRDQVIADAQQVLLGLGVECEVVDAGREAEPLVDACVEVLRVAAHVLAAHEPHELAVADVEEEVLEPAVVADLDEICADQREAEHVLVERARGLHVLRAEIDVVQSTGLEQRRIPLEVGPHCQVGSYLDYGVHGKRKRRTHRDRPCCQNR
jgi:hypothetical protein